LILGAVALSYIHNDPPFRGFALMGVVVYVMAFFFVLSFIPLRKLPFASFFKSISYEMYLCQGIFFLLCLSSIFPGMRLSYFCWRATWLVLGYANV